MELLFKRAALLIIYAVLLFIAKKRQPISWVSVFGPIFIVPMMGLIWEYIFEVTMLIFNVQDGIKVCAIYAAMRAFYEIMIIAACLIMYQGISGDFNDLLPGFFSQPVWSYVTVILIVILSGVLNFYNHVSLLEFMRALNSYDAPDNSYMISIIMRVSTPSIWEKLCSLTNTAIVAVEAIVYMKKIPHVKPMAYWRY